MAICDFCGLECECAEEISQLDQNQQGFWCENCDAFNYWEHSTARHQFTSFWRKVMRQATLKNVR